MREEGRRKGGRGKGEGGRAREGGKVKESYFSIPFKTAVSCAHTCSRLNCVTERMCCLYRLLWETGGPCNGTCSAGMRA